MSCFNIQTWIQARKCYRLRLKAAGRHEACAVGRNTGRIRRWYRVSAPLMMRVSPREVYTLNPANFLKANQRPIDLSWVCHPTIRVFSSANEELEYESTPVQLPYAMKPRQVDGIRGKRELWPDRSRGFLYYYSPPSRPRIAGEVRLRLTPTNDASSFQQGEDLSLDHLANSSSSSSQPWRRPLYSLATNVGMRPLYDKLIEEGLVAPELDKAIQSLPKLTFMYSRCQILHSLHDTFPIDLSSDWITLVAITEQGLETIHLLRQFRDLRSAMAPYAGAVLARFEPSPLPQHENTRTVVLRIVEELTPVRCLVPEYDEYIERPKPGHLFAKQFHGKTRPWSVDLDRPDKGKTTTMGLNLIWRSTPQLERRPL